VSRNGQLPSADHDVVVLGAGVAGIYTIKRLTDAGFDAIVLEGDDDLGGTWYRNRYPGSRFDSESYTYGYSWSPELLDEWHWKERFSGQPENLRYLRHVVERFDLRRFMRFNAHVESMEWDEAELRWHLHLADGGSVTARFVVTGIGLLSVPTMPHIDGMETFAGEAFHTYHWPAGGLDLSGLRVGVIGTGATGIQVISAIADDVAELHVFQRRPNWSAPLNNSPITDEEMADIRSRYDEIFAKCASNATGFEHTPDRRGFWNVTAEERRELWDALYDGPGFGILVGNFPEIFWDEEANAEFSAYIAERIRARVHDPVVADKLIPKDHGFGVQRVPLETNYFEVYNLDHVHLVDLLETPIQRILPQGIATADGNVVHLDVIVYATGFDAVTGAFDRMDIAGVGGEKLRTRWTDGPTTYLGVAVHGFPNLLMVAGPQSSSASSNFPRAIETIVDWVTDLLEHARDEGIDRVEASAEAEREWTDHVAALYQTTMIHKAQGWFTGYNSNVPGHEAGRVRHVVYNGGARKYAQRLHEVAEAGYAGMTLGTSRAG
jgi:cation diffusion facilitator CzcD-associated flavoprotein CzcO